VSGKNELFARARALLHLNTIPERFGLVLVEANAAGVPVIAMNLGSCLEVIKDRQTGFLVDNVTEAVRSLGRISEIDRRACRSRVRQYFSIDTMVEGYERDQCPAMRALASCANSGKIPFSWSSFRFQIENHRVNLASSDRQFDKRRRS